MFENDPKSVFENDPPPEQKGADCRLPKLLGYLVTDLWTHKKPARAWRSATALLRALPRAQVEAQARLARARAGLWASPV